IWSSGTPLTRASIVGVVEPVDWAPTGPPPPARSCATKAGSTAHTFNITGSSGRAPGMKGRDCQVLLRSPTLPFGLPVFSRVRPIQIRPGSFVGAASALLRRGKAPLVVRVDGGPYGSVPTGWAERRQNHTARWAAWPPGRASAVARSVGETAVHVGDRRLPGTGARRSARDHSLGRPGGPAATHPSRRRHRPGRPAARRPGGAPLSLVPDP